MAEQFDLVIIGTGAGGGTLAYALRESGLRILLVERGDFLPQEAQNWQPVEVFDHRRYKPDETWYGADGKPFHPGVHYFVGGNTKVYGAALPRFRVQDFDAVEHEGGTSPAWPVTYNELEPYYARAEEIYAVHGTPGEDPTEPPRSGPFPFPEVPHEPYIEDLSERLFKQGLHPFHYPMGIDLRDGGRCIRCKTCDGFPCQVLAKSESDVNCVRPALESTSITLWTNTLAHRLLTDDTGRRVVGVELERGGERITVNADRFVVACGAVNSALLLMRSANDKHPNGLANSSGLLGRNYMVHNNTALMAVDPLRRNATVFQKTMAVNDFYFKGPNFAYPMGNIQLLGKLQAGMLTAAQPLVPKPILQGMADRSVDWWVMSEDLPDSYNRVELAPNGKVIVHWKPNNLVAHHKLVEAARKMMRDAGYPFVFVQPMGIDTNSHQCGTARFGTDPATSVLDPFCRTHDVENLYVVDSSFFPSSAAMNPALTIAAQALRVAEKIGD
ncbi:MAG: GMC family oxidoreductase [Caldilinea sp.]|nr:GMC family oxidoreductase [Caldilineaceae bacterium]MCB9125940.1 GMC family oxidoreductase [Caldilineaceae bacterium]MCO5209955.1 GMC family oxidoreductase [Caldilinea sp.]